LAVAERLKRRWIGCDLGRFAIHTTRKRLMEIEDCKPFEILNLGKYERQVWQGISFSGKDQQTILYEYLSFILKLYGGEPISGFSYLHGRKGKALIHIGSVNAPVTIDDVMSAVKECIAAKQVELHVLGWEWEMGMHDLVEQEARKLGIKIRSLLIPNEVMDSRAIQKGEIKFFDVAYIKAEAIIRKNRVEIELQDFVIPNTELIPEDLRKKVRHWSDFIDYWAVDFDFQNDTFLNKWATYRAKQGEKLLLRSAAHEYQIAGKYKVLVKVIDVFGIDTSRLFEVNM
ncbi:MAG: DNA methyltransferase, partial [Nitrososphaera sp.]